MRRILREAAMIIALSLVIALLYNAASPSGIRLDRKPAPAGLQSAGQGR